jgi:hypothetical protein
MLSRRRVIVLVIVLVVGGVGVLLLLLRNSDKGQGKTVGVILAGSRDDYGWGDVTGGEYAETMIGRDRVILFDNLNEQDNPNLTLHDVVSTMLFSGARAFFLSSYLPEETPIAREFPNTVFVQNVSLESDVKAMLPTLVIVTVSREGPEPPGTTTHDVSFWVFLIGGLLAMATVVLAMGIYQARRSPPRE